MSSVDAAANEIHAKVVYYGPGLSGRTSNMQYVYERTHPETRSKMVSLATAWERQMSFDFVPRTLPLVRGMKVRLHLHTTPGAVYYDQTRARILAGVDVVIYVVDSQRERIEANVEMLEELAANLAGHGRALADVPLVLQYNKRDLPSAMPLAELDAALAPALGARDVPRIEAVATRGEGVFDTLRAAARLLLGQLARSALDSPRAAQ